MLSAMIQTPNTGTLPPSAATLGHPATPRFGFGRALTFLLLAFGLLAATPGQAGGGAQLPAQGQFPERWDGRSPVFPARHG